MTYDAGGRDVEEDGIVPSDVGEIELLDEQSLWWCAVRDG
jgi:hypothetical protein